MEAIPQNVRARKKLDKSASEDPCRIEKKKITIYSPQCGAGELLTRQGDEQVSHLIFLTISGYLQQTCKTVRAVVYEYEIHAQYPT
jgi:hypothetical protein